MSENICDGCVHKPNDKREYYDDVCFDTGKGARGMLAERVREPQAELFGFMADTRNTLAQVIARQDAQARDIAALKRDMEQVKRATGLK